MRCYTIGLLLYFLTTTPIGGGGWNYQLCQIVRLPTLNTDAKAHFKMSSRLKYMGGGVWDTLYILIVYGQSCVQDGQKVNLRPPPTPTENS